MMSPQSREVYITSAFVHAQLMAHMKHMPQNLPNGMKMEEIDNTQYGLSRAYKLDGRWSGGWSRAKGEK
jgi:hypothetical protein